MRAAASSPASELCVPGFPCSGIPILPTAPLGASLGRRSFAAPLTPQGFSCEQSYCPPCAAGLLSGLPRFRGRVISTRSFDVSSAPARICGDILAMGRLSDPRHIGRAARYRTGFGVIDASAPLCRLQRTPDPCPRMRDGACRSIRVGVSGRYPVMPPIGIPVADKSS